MESPFLNMEYVGEKVRCPHCGAKVLEKNFCSQCGGKLVETCDCPFLETKFNCGFDRCPGLKIHRLLLRLKRVKEKPPEDGTPAFDAAFRFARGICNAPD